MDISCLLRYVDQYGMHAMRAALLACSIMSCNSWDNGVAHCRLAVLACCESKVMLSSLIAVAFLAELAWWARTGRECHQSCSRARSLARASGYLQLYSSQQA